MIAEAHLKSGEEWEQKIIREHLLQNGDIVFPFNSPPPFLSSSISTHNNNNINNQRLSQQKLPYNQFIDILKKFQPSEEERKNKRYFIYQPTFIVPIEFYQHFGFGEEIKFSTCYPDFIQIIFKEEISHDNRNNQSNDLSIISKQNHE